jgi:SAM-dependent methyltransferase
MSLCSQIHHELHKAIIRLISNDVARAGALLDIGCWDGINTCDYGRVLSCKDLAGIEVFPSKAEVAQRRGIDVARINLEIDKFPWPSEKFDLVVCNQVFEHLKNIFHPMDEIARVLKPGGRLLISVPNLASFHNRVMLLLGMQPSSIRIFGPHVRGYSLKEFSAFLTNNGVFKLLRVQGVGFYPFPATFPGNWIAAIWKNACHTPIWLLERTRHREFSFAKSYAERSEQTHM